MATATAERILAALPQTQCTRCGYPDCAGYAQALARGEAAINRCPPGGAEGVARLAALTDQVPQALDPACGVEGPMSVAVIDEDWCIGCTLCLKVCPTDAILGSNKRLHTVIETYCTGCELCLAACPVDCIQMEAVSAGRTGWSAWSIQQADTARARYQARTVRLQRAAQEHEERLEENVRSKLSNLSEHSLHSDAAMLDKKRAVLEAALSRVRARRQV